MIGLIIDTSRDPAILGLAQDGQVLKMELLKGAKNLSATLFPLLQNFCKLQDLIFIAVGIGPGSYMGIRTAATVAKTLSFARELPLIEFCSPIAFLPKGKEGRFLFVDDAKMGQLYVLSGIAENGQIYNLSPPLLIPPTELEPHLKGKDFIVGLGNLTPEPNLEWIAHQTHAAYIKGNFSNSSSLTLTYLR